MDKRKERIGVILEGIKTIWEMNTDLSLIEILTRLNGKRCTILNMEDSELLDTIAYLTQPMRRLVEEGIVGVIFYNNSDKEQYIGREGRVVWQENNIWYGKFIQSEYGTYFFESEQRACDWVTNKKDEVWGWISERR